MGTKQSPWNHILSIDTSIWRNYELNCLLMRQSTSSLATDQHTWSKHLHLYLRVTQCGVPQASIMLSWRQIWAQEHEQRELPNGGRVYTATGTAPILVSGYSLLWLLYCSYESIAILNKRVEDPAINVRMVVPTSSQQSCTKQNCPLLTFKLSE